jgi:excinuclease ABC subunit A
MDKPDVDLIEGLSPSISIDQKTVSHNPRSTVGTITEIYEYRLLKDVLMTPWGDSSEMSLFTSIPEDLGFNHAEILKKLV